MKIATTFFLCLIAAATGAFFFALKREFIIILFPGYQLGLRHDSFNLSNNKKSVILFARQQDSWRTEQQELIWTKDTAENMRLLVTNWLAFNQEEHILEKKTNVQSCALSASGQELYISFDRNPLPKEQSIIFKWLLIESLLKTTRENNIPLVSIQILVNHSPLQDPHLSFDLPWPVNGFFE